MSLIEWRAKFKAHELSLGTPPEAFKLNSEGNYLNWILRQRETLWINACFSMAEPEDLPYGSIFLREAFEEEITQAEGYAPGLARNLREGKTYRGEFLDTKWREYLSNKTPSPSISRWQDQTLDMPSGPWIVDNGGSFDRTRIKPISDEMLEELALWLRLGYTPWNGQTLPLSDSDRQFMYLLYYSVQGLISRVRTVEAARPILTSELIDAIQTELYTNDREDGWCGHDVAGDSLKKIIQRVAKHLGVSDVST